MNPNTRMRYVRALRAMSTPERAAQLLEAYERELLDAQPTPLSEIEQLPNWTYDSLLAHAIQRREPPPGREAHDILHGRRYELVGLLARASEEAQALGDIKTAKAMARLCTTAIQHVIGLEALKVAFDSDLDDTIEA